MSNEKMVRQVLLATPTGKRPRCRPRTRRSDYISDIAWFCLGFEPAEISEITVGTRNISSSPEVAAPRPPQRKSGEEDE